jgi:hypothetical protein
MKILIAEGTYKELGKSYIVKMFIDNPLDHSPLNVYVLEGTENNTGVEFQKKLNVLRPQEAKEVYSTLDPIRGLNGENLITSHLKRIAYGPMVLNGLKGNAELFIVDCFNYLYKYKFTSIYNIVTEINTFKHEATRIYSSLENKEYTLDGDPLK